MGSNIQRESKMQHSRKRQCARGRMNKVISSLHASIARQTIALLRECGVYIPDDAAEHVIKQLRNQAQPGTNRRTR